jgi:nucleotide-binding universal stress UspA family protein
MPRIVVGVDGSEGATEALRWAVAEARLRGARLTVVNTWTVPLILASPSTETFGIHEPARSVEEVRTALRKKGDEVVEASLQAIDAAGVEVDGHVVEGSAAGVLIDAAEDAELLVVGSRGLGGFTGLLLGSVSQQCAHHAPCPVVIIPAKKTGDAMTS